MGKGQLQPNIPHTIVEGSCATSSGIAMGDVVILNTALSPDGWKKGDTAGALIAAGVAVNDVSNTETLVDVLIKGRIAVRAEEAIEPNSHIKVGSTGGVMQFDAGVDDPDMKKGFFAGYHDNPVDGGGLQQDPYTRKAAALNDIIIVDWENS